MPDSVKRTIHSVLFATDLSDNSLVALSYAASISYIYSARLFLVHVLDTAGATSQLDSPSSELRELAQFAKTKLERTSQSLLASQGIRSEVIVRHGSARDVIFQAQQECSADIVVLGSSGRKSGRGRALGSIAEAILRCMPCSVLTVGPNVERRSFPEKAQAILFPTDLSKASLTALPIAASLAADLSASLLLLHVCDTEGLPSCSGHGIDCKERLRKIATSDEVQKIGVEHFVQSGPIAERIVSLAKEKNTDLIVMAVRPGELENGTRIHGIVSNVVREAHCPVLTRAQ